MSVKLFQKKVFINHKRGGKSLKANCVLLSVKSTKAFGLSPLISSLKLVVFFLHAHLKNGRNTLYPSAHPSVCKRFCF